MATTATVPAPDETQDVFPINGTDYVEFYVGNATQAAHYYQGGFGFQLAGYRGPETGTRDRASYLLTQGKIRLVLTTSIRPEGPIAEHVQRHGDGVKDIALWVDDARDAFAKAVERGATPVHEPRVLKDDHGEVVVIANGEEGHRRLVHAGGNPHAEHATVELLRPLPISHLEHDVSELLDFHAKPLPPAT